MGSLIADITAAVKNGAKNKQIFYCYVKSNKKEKKNQQISQSFNIIFKNFFHN